TYTSSPRSKASQAPSVSSSRKNVIDTARFTEPATSRLYCSAAPEAGARLPVSPVENPSFVRYADRSVPCPISVRVGAAMSASDVRTWILGRPSALAKRLICPSPSPLQGCRIVRLLRSVPVGRSGLSGPTFPVPPLGRLGRGRGRRQPRRELRGWGR